MSDSRRGSTLLNELNRAEAKIETLEDFIRERERQLHVAVSRLQVRDRRSSRSRYAPRRRRAGITSDALLRMRTVSQESIELEDGVYQQSLGDYTTLRLIRIEESATSSTENHVPFMLSRLVGRHYHVGPEGATIGTSADCSICVPPESEAWPRHALIRWNAGTVSQPEAMPNDASAEVKKNHDSEWFDIIDLTEGQSVFKILPTYPSTEHPPTFQMRVDQFHDGKLVPVQSVDETEPATNDSNQSGFSTKLTHGILFQTGRLVWSLTALPEDQVLTIKMFCAAREGQLDKLCNIIESSQLVDHKSLLVLVSPPVTSHRISQFKFSTLSIVTEEGIDVNTEYRPPPTSDESSSSFQRVSTVLSPSSMNSVPTLHPSPYLLLHIAVVNNDLDMVLYLLDKGADVNMTSGPLSVTSLHLASRQDTPHILHHLLARGGDVEVKDRHHLTPLEVTSSYQIRKLLLNSVLLCAASEAGDVVEVSRLLTECDVPANVCGLRHKTPLHLAASQGHVEVVDVLLAHGANVNSRGGSHKRTPLHYASLYNHVAIATKLLAAGANEHARDDGGLTALNLSMGGDMCKLLHKQPLSLCLAVQSDDVQRVHQLLTEKEATGSEDNLVDQRNEQSHAPLHIACTAGNTELVELLISHGADVNLHGGCDGWTPLFYAAMAGHSDLVEFLLAVGANSEELDDEGVSVEVRVQGAIEVVQDRLKQLEKTTQTASTPGDVSQGKTLGLPLAISRQESGTTYPTDSERDWLLRRYNNLKTVSAVLTPAHERLLKAIDNRNLSEFIQVLSKESVSPDILVDRHYAIPVIIKTIQRGLFQFTEELLKREATVSANGPADQIPLLVAAENGHVDILQLLIAHGATVNTQSSGSGTTALHEAASSSSIECVQYLLDHRADRTTLNSDGEAAFDCTTELEIRQLLAVGVNRLLVAACSGDSHTIKALVNEEGFSPSHEFQQGVTALHEACEGGHEECVNVLIELGAETNKQTLTTQATPLHIASRTNNVNNASALLKAGAKLDIKDSEGKVPFEVANTNQMRKILIEARSLHVAPVQYQRQTSKESRLCKICMDNTINTIILPCGHQAFCTSCVAHISVCALDRKPIREVITVYK